MLDVFNWASTCLPELYFATELYKRVMKEASLYGDPVDSELYVHVQGFVPGFPAPCGHLWPSIIVTSG